jgi:hypothetical protein
MASFNEREAILGTAEFMARDRKYSS